MKSAHPLRSIAVARNAEELAFQAALYVAKCSAESIAARGRFVISLSGGSTPRELYRRLASPPFFDVIEWRRWFVLFSDERCVPPEHPDSNFKMANDSLLSRVGLESGSVIRVAGELHDPAVAAAEYASAVRTLLFHDSHLAPIDLSLLGIGEDGHTASIFPDVIDACRDADTIATAVFPESKRTWRVTLNLPVLCEAAKTMFLVSGAGKRSMLRSILSGDERFPAALVRNRAPSVAVFADLAAF